MEYILQIETALAHLKLHFESMNIKVGDEIRYVGTKCWNLRDPKKIGVVKKFRNDGLLLVVYGQYDAYNLPMCDLVLYRAAAP
jgi:CO dehydrogenase/acetyl-CoA synthase alpha subunit